LFVLSAILVSTGLASVAGAAGTSPTQQQGGYTNLVGDGQDCNGDNNDSNNGDTNGKPHPTCTKSMSAKPSETPSSPVPTKTTASPTPSKTTASPTPSETTSAAAVVTVTPSTLPVTGGSSAPLALVSGGLLLSGLTLLGVRLFLARRT
jgi:hypothetical protein